MQAFMGVGGLFGNVTPQSRTKVSVTITAVRNVDALYISTDTFYTIIKVTVATKNISRLPTILIIFVEVSCN